MIGILAFTNLQQVYNSQKDFVVGLLASLAGFCFAKAFSRATEEKALELIRRAPAGVVADAVQAALRRASEFKDALSDTGVPKVFEIMLSDLTSARDCLQRLDLPDAAE